MIEHFLVETGQGIYSEPGRGRIFIDAPERFTARRARLPPSTTLRQFAIADLTLARANAGNRRIVLIVRLAGVNAVYKAVGQQLGRALARQVRASRRRSSS